MNTTKLISVLFLITIGFAQLSTGMVEWTLIDNAGSYTLPSERSTPSAEDLAHAAEVGSTYVAPPEASPEAKASYEAYVNAKMQEKNPPVVLIELTLPTSRGDIDREILMDGHVLRNGRVYMKPQLIFDVPELISPIFRIAPLRRGVSASSITTVQEAIDAMDLNYVSHSTKTIEGDLYIDITDIVDGIESGDIPNTLVLSPLSPRERFSLPEASREMGAESGGEMFEIVVTEE